MCLGVFYPVFPFFVNGDGDDFYVVFFEESFLYHFRKFVHEYLAVAASGVPEDEQGVRVYFVVEVYRLVV